MSKLQVGVNDLATLYPGLAKEWHPTKNGNLLPTMVTTGSGKKVWWQCEKGHGWEAAIYSRVKGNGCPYCSGHAVLKGFNDLATTNHKLAKEWHPTKNGDLLPTMVTTGSEKKVWWQCEKGHEWQAMIKDRTKGNGCPICAKETQTSFPEQTIYYYIKQVFPDAINGDTSAIGKELDVYIPFLKAAIEYDGMHWHKTNKCEQQKNKLCREGGIKLIRIREKGLPMYDDCICIERNNRKSNDSLNDAINTIFKILKIETKFNVDVDKDQNSVLELYIKNKKSNSLAAIFPDIAKEWHPTKNGNLTPKMVTKKSNKKVWWLGECGHEWLAQVNNRTNGNGCPYCSGRKHQRIKCIETKKIYYSFQAAAKSCGIKNSTNIAQCCHSKQKTAGGYHWQFCEG